MPRAPEGRAENAVPKKRAEARDFSVYHNDQKVGGRKTPPKASGGGGGCCGLFGKREPPFEQTIVLLRHSERVDYVDQNYPNTAEGKKWPHDAPLTTRGHELAADVARSLRSLHEKAHFSAVATSPYRRCLETSAAVARELHLPVIVDQELGEVWDRQMPQSPNPFRPNDQLRPLIESLKIKDANPSLEDGSLKLFGKPPKWPESLDDAKTRYLVRIEEYIEQSMLNSRNYILVTHADAVAAALQMFEHGNSDVQNLDFCARCIASRKVPARSKDSIDDSVWKDKWQITTEGVKQETMAVDKKLEKYYEKQHMENVEEKQEAAARRKANRTKTDAAFGERMKAFAEEADEDEAMSSQERDQSPPQSPQVPAKPASSTSKSKDQSSTAPSSSKSKDQQSAMSSASRSKDQQRPMSPTTKPKDQQRPMSPNTKSKDQQSIASSTSKSKDQQSSRSKESRGNARV